MRTKTGAVLLLACAWHLVSPLAAWSSPQAADRGVRIASPQTGSPTYWVPRAAAAVELGRLPDGGNARVPLSRILSAGSVTAVARDRGRTVVHRPTYPARRTLSRRRWRADDDSPA